LGLAAHRLYSGNSKRRAASPRKIIVLFLPLHEAAGDPDAVSQISGSAGQSFGYRGDGNAESYLWAWRDFITADENQMVIPGAFSDEDLPCACRLESEKPELP
jgi:hypothetical protein